ncbi:MAG: hypothetical protein HYS08_02580 [Chlamydiae bacterium]|nr:hypothetical protein [Chlamydiota bacterium]MBI3266616.1 hypothetical protein [Chlamydiota bacterium]
MKKLFLSSLLIFSLSSSSAQTPPVSTDAQQQEILKYYQGMYQLKTDYRAEGKIARIQDRLNKAYGMNIRVIPGQTGRAAMSFGRGIIVLDLSISGSYDEETIAGLLSHEWAHEYLGHLYNFQYGYLQGQTNPYTQLETMRKMELEADCVGMKHLGQAGYSPAGFIQLIIEKGDVEAFKHPNLRMYFPPEMRLQAILECSLTLDRKSQHLIQAYLGLPLAKTEQKEISTLQTPCIHQKPCEHIVPCIHLCQDPKTSKTIPCHLYDTEHPYDTEHEHDE